MVEVFVNQQIETFEEPIKEEEEEKKLTKKQKEKISNESINKLQEEVITYIALKRRAEATELIVSRIEQENYIYTTKDDIKSEMWIYQDGIYIPQGKSFIKEFCRKIFGEVYTPQLAGDVIAKIEADTYIDHDKFFKSEYFDEIPLQNGILNLTTRKLGHFNHTKIFFNKLPIKYNPKSKCPNITKFFEEVLKDKEDVKVMFEIFGYALLKDYKFEKAFMLVGNGRNGKSKTLSLVKRFLGANNCCSIPLSQIIPSSTSVCELYGRLVNMAGDLSNLDLKDTGMFKQVTGRDLITAKRKYLRDLIFTNYAKLLFACNELPKVYDTKEGFWSRWIVLEFPYRFVSQEEFETLTVKEKEIAKIRDEEIIEKIVSEEELSGLLNASLKGLDRLIEHRDFSYSKGTKEVKDLWIRQSDSFMAFCLEHVQEHFEGKVSKKDLRKSFFRYCKEHKIKGASDKAIKVVLEDNYGVIESQLLDGDRVWEGIILKNSGELTK